MNYADGIILCFSLLGLVAFGFSVAAASTQLKELSDTGQRGTDSLTLLVPVRNESLSVLQILKEQLLSLKDNSAFDFRIIDNGSAVPLRFDDVSLDQHILCTAADVPGSKKSALKLGIEHSHTDWIVTTDADTRWTHDWLNIIAQQATKDRSMLVGPVFSEEDGSFCSILSYYESLCLWTIALASCSAGSPILASGANLAFRKSAWLDVGGYASHLSTPSGDDVLLMAEIWRRYPQGIGVLKGRNAYTTTTSESQIADWMAQRKRWISKTAHLNSPFKKIFSLLIMLWLYSPIVLVLLHPAFTMLWIGIEFCWIFNLARWYRINYSLPRFLVFRLVYPIMIPFVFFSMPKTWK
jgi:cellulose synthase/poly-beta-1,6-N-acetylglucosamine synthase-like glycosyltransferase